MKKTLLPILFLGISFGSFQQSIGLSVSKCPLEFLLDEDPVGCHGMQDFFQDKPLHSTSRLAKGMYWLQTAHSNGYVKNVIQNAGITLTTNRTKEWIGSRRYVITNDQCKNTKVNSYRKYNRIPGTAIIAQKHKLATRLNKFVQKFGKEEFPFFLRTFNLPQEFQAFKERLSNSSNELWILKPGLGARATHVKLIRHLEEVKEYLRKRKVNSVAQKYVAQPYLFKGRKIVSRIYVLITSVNPLRVYAFKDGHTYIAFENYTASLAEIDNQCVHIPLQSSPIGGTGTCRNAESNSIRTGQELEEKYSITNLELFAHLASEGADVGHLWKKLEEMIVKTILSGVDELEEEGKRCFPFPSYNGYQEFAIEFILDKEFNPYLIEVNRMFSMMVKSPLTLKLKSEFVKSSMTLAGFQPPPSYLRKQGLPPSLSYDFKASIQDERKHRFFFHRILDDLSPWDIRELLIAEDELARAWSLKRIFPKRAGMEAYTKYFLTPAKRYSFLLQKTWEQNFGSNRTLARHLITKKCSALLKHRK